MLACASSIAPSAAQTGRSASAQPHAAADDPVQAELDRALADLCDKQVVLLGETGGHGSARTWATKGTLLLRLIDTCGFDAVFIESAIYEFLDLAHALEEGTATPERLADAVGELWSRAEESQPWLHGLFERAAAGRVTVAGLTGAVHTTAHYASDKLPDMLAGYLSGERRTLCGTTLDRYMNWRYDDAHPYTDDVRQEVRACADAARAEMATRPASPLLDEHLVMAASFSRSLGDERRRSDEKAFNARDALMYDHFKWHRDRLPLDARIIVWCATIHAAKDLSGVPGREGYVPLGAHVHHAYGERAAAIGFSAYAGSWARIRQPIKPIQKAPPGSIEAQVPLDQDLRYLGSDQLRAFGEILARPLSHDSPQRARWSDVIDGLIVFREERAPRFIESAE